MSFPLRRSTTVIVGVLLVVFAALAWRFVRPVFWSVGGLAAPEHFDDQAAVTTALVDVTAAAGFHHQHHKPYLDPQLEPIMSWVASVGAAAAYVDKMPTRGGMAAIVSKGTLARKALDQVDLLVAADRTWWPAIYTRAVNHLHWPRALKHSGQAARDFRHCIAVQTEEGASPNARSYYVRAYIGLGDALAKDGRFAEARKAWRQGLEIFPGNPGTHGARRTRNRSSGPGVCRENT